METRSRRRALGAWASFMEMFVRTILYLILEEDPCNQSPYLLLLSLGSLRAQALIIREWFHCLSSFCFGGVCLFLRLACSVDAKKDYLWSSICSHTGGEFPSIE